MDEYNYKSIERPIGYIDDYNTWSNEGCARLALAVAAQKGRQYSVIYAAWKRAKSEEKKKYYYAHLNSIKNFFEKGFIGAFIDSETVLSSIRYNVDKDLGILK